MGNFKNPYLWNMTKVNFIADKLGPTLDWTVERYHAMIETGIFGKEDRFELLYGKIVLMSPIGRFHAASVSKLAAMFIRRLADAYSCRQEQPITMTEQSSSPEPDYVVANYRDDAYASGHPTAVDIHLIVEVSDHTLAKDQTVKYQLYAEAGIPEYWIISLIERQIEIYTQPKDVVYQNTEIYREGEQLEHELLGAVEVDALLP